MSFSLMLCILLLLLFLLFLFLSFFLTLHSDTVRRCMQVSDPGQWSLRSICGRIYTDHGLKGFYAGFSASVLKALPSAAVASMVIDHCGRAIEARR